MEIVPLALASAANPTLLAATAVMLLSSNPKPMLSAYLLGGWITSVTFGLVIVFSLHGSDAVSTEKTTVDPLLQIALGVLALAVAYALHIERDKVAKEHKEALVEKVQEMRGKSEEEQEAEESAPPRWQQALDKGSAPIAFAVGVVLSLPGASYIAALTSISTHDWSTVVVVVVVLLFNAVMFILMEVPLLAYVIAPDTTPRRVKRLTAWLNRNGREIGIKVAVVIGVLLIVRGAIELLI
jgi:hypothetical protein